MNLSPPGVSSTPPSLPERLVMRRRRRYASSRSRFSFGGRMGLVVGEDAATSLSLDASSFVASLDAFSFSGFVADVAAVTPVVEDFVVGFFMLIGLRFLAFAVASL